jgi:hypothetical protein
VSGFVANQPPLLLVNNVPITCDPSGEIIGALVFTGACATGLKLSPLNTTPFAMVGNLAIVINIQ